MSKLLSVRDKILLTLSMVADVHNDLKTLGGVVGKRKSYYTETSRLMSSGMIEKVLVGGEARLRITSKGKFRFKRDFPFTLFQNKKWDGRWRIVTFDISEKKRPLRDKLRRKLRELGFGMLQQSIWISPHNLEDDIREFLILNKLGKKAFLFVSDKVLVGEIESLIENLWHLSAVNNLYKAAYENKDRELYFEAISIDPFLPKQLLPKPWWSEKAKGIL